MAGPIIHSQYPRGSQGCGQGSQVGSISAFLVAVQSTQTSKKGTDRVGRLTAFVKFKDDPEIPDLETLSWSHQGCERAIQSAANKTGTPGLETLKGVIIMPNDIREVTITWKEK